MPIFPAQYQSTSPYKLLREVEMGRAGFDQRMIRSITARPEQAVPDLVRFASEFRSEKLLDLEDQLLDLFRFFRTPKALPFYLHLLANAPEDEIPDDLIMAFAELGEASVDPLLKRYKDLGADDAPNIPFLLAALGVRDDRILAVLLEKLTADVFEGALCLGLYGDPTPRPVIESALAQAEGSDEKAALESCLEQLGRDVEPPEFADPLEHYPETAPPIMDLVSPEDRLAFLESDDAEYRAEAAKSLYRTDYASSIQHKLLEMARHDPDVAVRGQVLEALGLHARDPQIAKLLLDVASDPARPLPERRGAIAGLGDAAKNKQTHALICDAYGNPELRTAALVAMGRARDTAYESQVLESLESTDLSTQTAAAVAAGIIPLPAAAGSLRKLFDNDDLRETALYAYALSIPLRVTAKSVERLYSDIEQLSGGLSLEEADAVSMALDERLENAGLPRVFFPDDDDLDEDLAGGPGPSQHTVH